jgi:hypothetical protein
MKKSIEAGRESVSSAVKEARELKKKYGIRITQNWDADLAAEAARELREQEKGLEGEELRYLLMTRWLDAFTPPNGQQSESDLATEHAIEPIRLRNATLDLLHEKSRVNKTSDALEPEGRSFGMPLSEQDLDIRLYGTDVLVDVRTAGTWVKIPAGMARAVGSSKFSCCTAIVGVSESGELCYAHVPGPGWHELKRIGKAMIEEKFGPGKYVMITPERKLVESADKQSKQWASEVNRGYRDLAEELGIEMQTYTEMYPDEESVLRDTHVSQSILLTNEGVQVQQTRQLFNRSRSRNSFADHQIRDKKTSELDISFADEL